LNDFTVAASKEWYLLVRHVSMGFPVLYGWSRIASRTWTTLAVFNCSAGASKDHAYVTKSNILNSCLPYRERVSVKATGFDFLLTSDLHIAEFAR
jgi:hypothetical protein